jgi:hypothetical protein
MRFQFYNAELDTVPKLSVDGTVDNSVHFSHWQGNETPVELKADTSTEIALNLVASPKKLEFTKGIELVTNNHFDTDGVLSVWTVLHGERALDHRANLIAAAETGDFSEFRSDAGVKISLVIQGPDQAGGNNDTVSPLARQLNGEQMIDDARCYDLVLPKVEDLLTNIAAYEALWREGWDQIVIASESFERGESSVEEIGGGQLSLIRLAPQIFGSSGFDPNQHATPQVAISRYAHGHLFLIAVPLANGWSYRIDYPYYSWAETVVRQKIVRKDLGPLLDQLNRLESSRSGVWKVDNNEMTSAAKFLGLDDVLASSRLTPEVVAQTIRNHFFEIVRLSASDNRVSTTSR